MADSYIVSLKPSARRINTAAAEWVGRRESTRTFASKRDAKAWARAISGGDGDVRIQDAAPNDPAPIDGYLVADPARDREAPTEPPESDAIDAY